MNTPPRQVTCPTCGKAVLWTSEQRWRPFCCERCRLIDLGEWFAETHRIPADDAQPADDDADPHRE
ncbi:MAG: DNA gyrase inhibitor YacG [Gammaproteobacteria bacterium]